MRFGPIELYKKLPKTNCGDCGQPSCLAFATQVVGFGQELGDCPHLDEATLEEVARTIEGKGIKVSLSRKITTG
jgi:CO dehydrogenase/acetyl-CoA synthase gamma subunit (corrinoid Fe-S protein)